MREDRENRSSMNMKTIFKKIDRINQLRITEGFSIGFIVFLNLILVSIFAKFYQIKFNLDNPLIPKDLIVLAFEPYAKKGVIVSCGLLIVLTLKFLKQNLFVIIVSLILISIYLFTNHHIGSWNTEIN